MAGVLDTLGSDCLAWDSVLMHALFLSIARVVASFAFLTWPGISLDDLPISQKHSKAVSPPINRSMEDLWWYQCVYLAHSHAQTWMNKCPQDCGEGCPQTVSHRDIYAADSASSYHCTLDMSLYVALRCPSDSFVVVTGFLRTLSYHYVAARAGVSFLSVCFFLIVRMYAHLCSTVHRDAVLIWCTHMCFFEACDVCSACWPRGAKTSQFWGILYCKRRTNALWSPTWFTNRVCCSARSAFACSIVGVRLCVR